MDQQSGIRKKFRKELTGIVTSDKMQKTRVVEVMRLTRHDRYGKTIKARKTFKVHDENNESKIGDRVRICEIRPMSKDKRWRVAQIIARAKIEGGS